MILIILETVMTEAKMTVTVMTEAIVTETVMQEQQ